MFSIYEGSKVVFGNWTYRDVNIIKLSYSNLILMQNLNAAGYKFIADMTVIKSYISVFAILNWCMWIAT